MCCKIVGLVKLKLQNVFVFSNFISPKIFLEICFPKILPLTNLTVVDLFPRLESRGWEQATRLAFRKIFSPKQLDSRRFAPKAGRQRVGASGAFGSRKKILKKKAT
jgi:hypothetical protein